MATTPPESQTPFPQRPSLGVRPVQGSARGASAPVPCPGGPWRFGWLLILLLAAPPLTAAADGDARAPSPQSGGMTAEQRYLAAEAQRRELAEANARLRARLEAAGRDSDLAARIDAQTAAIRALTDRFDRMETAASRPDPASLTPAASGEAAGTGATAEPSPAQLRAALADTDRRLRLLIDQFAEAHRLRLRALDQAAAARARVAKQNAQLQQQQLVVQEARLHAEKAEKLHAAAEEARARATTENERLSLELATTRERLADALQQVVSLDARLATAEARVDQLQGTAKEVLGQPSHVIIEPSVAENAASPSSPGSAADNPPPAAADTHHAHPTQAVTPAVYLVRADDNLSLISAKVYGDAGAWRRIYDANRDVLQTPDALVPGMTLVIP